MRQLEHHEISTIGTQQPIWLLCANWRDPRNVGSAFRLAEAAGLSGLLLAGTTPCPPHPKIAKTARATERYVAYHYAEDATGLLEEWLEKGAFALALEITDESTSLLDYALPTGVADGSRPLVLIAGAEDHGVAPDLLERCSASVHLPMHGVNTSMNVAVALGASIYLLLSQYAKYRAV